jgi:DNA-binding NarL/FixJ family response regulator
VKTPRSPTGGNSSHQKCISKAVKIAVVDQSPLFRAGVVHVLNAGRGLEVVSVSDTFQLGAIPPPDVVILDADLMMSAIGAARSNFGFSFFSKVLVLAWRLDEDQFLAAFAAGARGYLLKGASESQVLEAVFAVHRGEGYVSPGVAATMLTRRCHERHGKGGNENLADQLSHREGEIFKLLPTGLTNREIGQRLDLTENTIKRYLTRIFEKLHVRNRVEAAMLSRLELKAEVLQERKQTISIPALSLAFAHAKDNPGCDLGLVGDSAALSNGGSPPWRGNGLSSRPL